MVRSGTVSRPRMSVGEAQPPSVASASAIAHQRRGFRAPIPLAEVDDERSVLVEQLAVDANLAPLAQIADHVPVDGGDIRSAGDGDAGPERHVEGARDLLVEERLPHE